MFASHRRTSTLRGKNRPGKKVRNGQTATGCRRLRCEPLEERRLLNGEPIIAAVEWDHEDFRYIAGHGRSDWPAVEVEFRAHCIGDVQSVQFELGGRTEVDDDASDNASHAGFWTTYFDMSELVNDSDLVVTAIGSSGDTDELYDVKLIDQPGWLLDEGTEYDLTWDFDTGYRFDNVVVQHVHEGFTTPSEEPSAKEWQFRMPGCDEPILDLSDRFTGFDVASHITFVSEASGEVATESYQFEWGGYLMGEKLFGKTLDAPAEESSTKIPEWGEIKYGASVVPSLSNNLLLDGVDVNAWIHPDFHATLPLGSARFPLFSVPGIADIQISSELKVDFDSKIEFTPSLTSSGVGLESFSVSTTLVPELAVSAEVDVALGFLEVGIEGSGRLEQTLDLSYDSNSDWAVDAPGNLSFSITPYYTWLGDRQEAKEIWKWEAINWNLAQGDISDPGTDYNRDPSERYPILDPQGTYCGLQVNGADAVADDDWFRFPIVGTATDGSTIRLTTNAAHDVSFQVFDRGGNLVGNYDVSADGQLITCDVSGLSNGWYDIRVYNLTQGVDPYYDLSLNVNSDNNIDVVPVIDRSGSMGSPDKIGSAKAAATQFVDLMQMGDKIGVVSYDTTATTNFPLTEITDETVRDQAQAAIDAISSGGGTSIGAGVRAAYDELDRSTKETTRAMLVMSDGQHNTSPNPIDVINSREDLKDVIVYTIGFGADADDTLLAEMAEIRGGDYFYSTTVDLPEIYFALRARLTGEQQTPSSTQTIYEGQETTHSLWVDFAASSATFVASWQGSDVDLSLVAPDGTIIDHAVAAADPSVSLFVGETYEIYQVSDPAGGDWQMVADGVDIPSGGETLNLYAALQSIVGMSISTDKLNYAGGESVHIQASLADDWPILDAAVTATVEAPAGAGFDTQQIMLYDDGIHGDGAADDGVYGNDFDQILWEGSYTVSVDAEGESGVAGPFVRHDFLSIAVTQPPNQAPVAVAGGPYTVQEGDDLALDGSGSTDPDPDDVLTYRWDVDGDGDYDENVTGVAPTLTWAELVALGVDNGPDTRTVTLEVSDGIHAAMDTASLTVENGPPVLDPIAGPDSGVRCQPLLYSVDFTDLGTTDTHTATIDWGDGSPVEQASVQESGGSGTVTGVHQYTDLDNYVITITVEDNDSGQATAETTVEIERTLVGDDPQQPGERALFVGGSLGDDCVHVFTSSDGHLSVKMSHGPGWIEEEFEAGPDGLTSGGHVYVFTCDGDDEVDVDSSVTHDAEIYLGPGNDVGHGGSGNDKIDGDAGNDELKGGDGDDYLAGGAGKDELEGDDGNDILMGSDPVVFAWTDPSCVADFYYRNLAGQVSSGTDLDDDLEGGDDNDALIGMAGSDELSGDSGNDILLGCEGNDDLEGDDGRDLLIGGTGMDEVEGDDGCDLLIGGTTCYDTDADAMMAIMAEWTRCDITFTARVDHLENGGGWNNDCVLVVDDTVLRDGLQDDLDGGSDEDWIPLPEAVTADAIGVHRGVGSAGYFIQDPNGNGGWDGGDRFYIFGNCDDTPIIGDWNGDGYDEIGVHRAVGSAGYFIQDYNGNGGWDAGDRYFIFGDATDTPIIGDWDGDGDDDIGVHRAVGSAGYFIQDYSGNGGWDGDDRYFIFGDATDTPIIGDWDGDGDDEIGVHRGVGAAGYFIQDYSSNGGWDGGDRYFIFGDAGDTPLIADWDGDGDDEIGVHRAVGAAGYFIQDYTSNGGWDAGDRYYIFGDCTDTPLIGNWGQASPLMADLEQVPSGEVAALTTDELAPVVEAAIDNWSAAVLTADQADALQHVDVRIADLPGARLAETCRGTITLDVKAAGFGWFVDATPSSNEEFGEAASGETLTALEPEAVDRIDLLTVVEHELGHILGLEDLDALADSLMSETLQPGVRREVTAREVDLVLSGYDETNPLN